MELNKNNNFTHEEVVEFFNENLENFRLLIKESKTKHEQDINIRFCEATSYLKQMWISKKIKL
jgi:hypothetical protein